MDDTEILDFIQASIDDRKSDYRWGVDYMCHLGVVSFSLGQREPRPFRELIRQAALDQVTARLKAPE